MKSIVKEYNYGSQFERRTHEFATIKGGRDYLKKVKADVCEARKGFGRQYQEGEYKLYSVDKDGFEDYIESVNTNK